MVKALSGMDDRTKEFLAEKQDLNPVWLTIPKILALSSWHQKKRDQMAFLNPTLNKLESKFKLDNWKAAAGKVDT